MIKQAEAEAEAEASRQKQAQVGRRALMKLGPLWVWGRHRSASANRGLAKQAMPQEPSWLPVRKRTSRRFQAPKLRHERQKREAAGSREGRE